MSSFNTQHPIANAFDRSALSADQLASSGLAGFSSNSSTTFTKDSAMRHSHTSRGLRASAKTLMAVLGLGLATACSDSLSTPVSQVSVQAPAGFDQIVGVQTFTYNPKTGVTHRLGDNVISIPAGAVCKADEYYALHQWDQPCKPVNHSIVFTATTFNNAAGAPYVEFQPAVRFSPDKEVDLYLRDGKRTTPGVLGIYWCPTVGAACVDESTTDGTLATSRVGTSSILVRRVKHFSGFVITFIGDCDGIGTVQYLDDGSMFCSTDGGFSRSGYMVASGLTKGSGSAGGSRRSKRGWDQ